jgi:hypothetical protein
MPISPSAPPAPTRTGAPACTTGADDGRSIAAQSWLSFPYDSTLWRSHYLHPHPYILIRTESEMDGDVCGSQALVWC